MTREETQVLKGVAILWMLWYHVFNRYNIDYWTPLISIGDTSLVTIIQSITSPVYMYIMLSGYGLYMSYRKDGITIRKTGTRILKLFLQYWLVLIVFALILGSLLKPDVFPGSFSDLILSFTGIHTKYCGEAWFLIPYVLLVLISLPVFKLIDKNVLAFFAIAGAFFLGSVYVKRTFDLNQEINAGLIVAWLNMILPFGIGSLMAKYSAFEFVKAKLTNNYIILLLLLIACACDYCIPNVHILFVPCVMLLVLSMKLYKGGRILKFFGKYSTPMWFIHGFFYRSLFHDFIYYTGNPIIIYVTLLACTLVSAIIIDFLNGKLQTVLRINSL